jgi:hypothetical protein
MAYTTIDDPSAYFHTQLFTGTGSELSVTNDANAGDFKPDWIWIKQRNAGSTDHGMFDSSRGVTKNLKTNTADTESTEAQSVKTFNTDGFTLGTSGDYNGSSDTHVAWQWKANGGTTSSNSDGSITSTVQASTTSGFSIVTYTGNGSQGATIGHGLGVVPNVVLVKGRSVGDSWTMLHSGIASDFETDMIKLDETGAAQDNSVFWNDTAPTSSVFSVDGAGGEPKVNESGSTYVAYCFANKQGYSKFNSFTGNGSTDGPFIYTGFKPAWLMIKEIISGGGWGMWDNKRTPTNAMTIRLLANTNGADDTSTDNSVDFLSNGFKMRTSSGGFNQASTEIIYIAFAESPFVSSEGVPTTAR